MIHPMITVGCGFRGPAGTQWFAQLRLLFSFRRRYCREAELCAFVRWYETTPKGLPLGKLPHTRPATVGHQLTALRWAADTEYDVVAANNILRPVVLQPHPTDPEQFVYNHFFESDVTV